MSANLVVSESSEPVVKSVIPDIDPNLNGLLGAIAHVSNLYCHSIEPINRPLYFWYFYKWWGFIPFSRGFLFSNRLLHVWRGFLGPIALIPSPGLRTTLVTSSWRLMWQPMMSSLKNSGKSNGNDWFCPLIAFLV